MSRQGLENYIQWNPETPVGKQAMFKAVPGDRIRYYPHTKKLLLVIAPPVPEDIENDIPEQPEQRAVVKPGMYITQSIEGFSVMDQATIDARHPEVDLEKLEEEKRQAEADRLELEKLRAQEEERKANEDKDQGNGEADQSGKGNKTGNSKANK